MALIDATAASCLELATVAWLGVIATAVILLYRSLHPKTLPGIPIGFPDGLDHVPWLVGFGLVLKRALRKGEILAVFNAAAARHSPIWQVPIGPAGTWLGRSTGFGRTFVVCTDSQEIEDACTRRASTFAKSHEDIEPFKFASPAGQFGLLAGPEHRHHRRVFGPSMTGAYLARMTPRIEDCVDELVLLWKARSAQAAKQGGKAIDVGNDLLLCAIDISTSLAFGKSLGSIKDTREHVEALPIDAPPESSPPLPRMVDCLNVVQRQIATVSLAGPLASIFTFYYTFLSKATRQAKQDVVSALATRIAEERALREETHPNGEASSPPDADHVLGMVLDGEAADQAKGHKPLPQNELFDELLLYVGAGSDATATATKWALKYLARHPEKQQRMRAELVKCLPNALQSDKRNDGGISTFEGLNNEQLLPYTTATAYECLRLAQVTSVTVRSTEQDTTLLGYSVPVGTRVVFLTGWASASASEKRVRHKEGRATGEGKGSKEGQRKRVYWGDDVDDFRPERWLKQGPDGTLQFDRSAGPWLPFGAGARGCFGKNLAMLMFKVILVKLVGSFNFEPVPAVLDDDVSHFEHLLRHPAQAYVRLTSLDPSSILCQPSID